MRFELGYLPMPDGYGEGILSLEACKAHLRVTSADEDDLIAALRDAAIEYVERYCGVKLGPVTGLTWRAGGFGRDSYSAIELGVRPVTAITAVGWIDGSGNAVSGTLTDFRVTTDGRLFPAVGAVWPSDVGAEAEVTFDAGFADGAAPPTLITAVKLLLAHLFQNREAVLTGPVAMEPPFGVTALCSSFRPVVL